MNNLFKGISFSQEDKIHAHIQMSLLMGKGTKGNIACCFHSFLQVFQCGSSLRLITLSPSNRYHPPTPRSYHTMPYNTIQYHTIQYHTIPYNTISYHTMPYHTIPYNTIPYHTIPYHIIPYHTIPYHTIPYHTIPYHTIPYHTIPSGMSEGWVGGSDY